MSAARKQSEDIVHVGQRYIREVDDHGTESWAKFPMCKGLGQHKILGSVSSGIWTLGGADTQAKGVTHKTTPMVTEHICGSKNGSHYLDTPLTPPPPHTDTPTYKRRNASARAYKHVPVIAMDYMYVKEMTDDTNSPHTGDSQLLQ